MDEANLGEDENASVFTDNQDFEIANGIKEKLVCAFSGEIFQHLEALIGSVDRNTKVDQ
jgi:hypothetical protein